MSYDVSANTGTEMIDISVGEDMVAIYPQIIDLQTAFANKLFIVSYNLDNVLKSEVQP